MLLPRGPRFKIELVSARSREHCERHNSFSCSGKTVACRRAASYRRGLVSAAAARPLPRRPSPARKPGADAPSPGTRAAPGKRSETFRRPPARPPSAREPLHLAKSSARAVAPREWARKAKGNPSRRWRGASPQPTRGIFHLIRSTLPPPSQGAHGTHSYDFRLPPTGWAGEGARVVQRPVGELCKESCKVRLKVRSRWGQNPRNLVGMPPQKCTTRFLNLDGSQAGKKYLQDRPARVYLSQGTGWVSTVSEFLVKGIVTQAQTQTSFPSSL